jgi:hypothetical protein
MSSWKAAQAAFLDDALQILHDFGDPKMKDSCFESQRST